MSTAIPDPWPAMQEAAAALGAPGQPQALYATLDRVLGRVLGHKLFTIMNRDPATGESERLYSNQPGPYPVGGKKQMKDTPWFREVIIAKKHYLGRTAADVRWAFFDHALIASLGCGSAVNLLAIHDGTVLGAINMLHEDGWYDERHIAAGAPFAQLLVAAFTKQR